MMEINYRLMGLYWTSIALGIGASILQLIWFNEQSLIDHIRDLCLTGIMIELVGGYYLWKKKM